MIDTNANDAQTRLCGVILEGVKENVGQAALAGMMEGNDARSGETSALSLVMQIQDALIDAYGLTGGRGIAQCSGRAAFKYLLRGFADDLHLTSPDFKLQPAPARLRKGLEALARLFSNACGMDIAVFDLGSCWEWRMKTGEEIARKMSPFIMGLLQEFGAWVSGGRFHPVVEATSPNATVDVYTLQFVKKSLDN